MSATLLADWLAGVARDNVTVKGFQGSTVSEMSDYIERILRQKQDNIALHMGTNDNFKRNQRNYQGY